MTSLQAAGRVRVEGVDIPKNRWGLGGDETGYETRKIKKTASRWEMDMYPTETYMLNEDIRQLESFQSVQPPRGSQRGEIPAWYGITDHPISDLWGRILVAVSGVVALRTGVSQKELRKLFRPTLEEWEIELLLQWGGMLDLFTKVDPEGVIDGWGVGEWWYLMVGTVCRSMDKGKGIEEGTKVQEDQSLAEQDLISEHGPNNDAHAQSPGFLPPDVGVGVGGFIE
jgi:hypothetical protein